MHKSLFMTQRVTSTVKPITMINIWSVPQEDDHLAWTSYDDDPKRTWMFIDLEA